MGWVLLMIILYRRNMTVADVRHVLACYTFSLSHSTVQAKDTYRDFLNKVQHFKLQYFDNYVTPVQRQPEIL